MNILRNELINELSPSEKEYIDTSVENTYKTSVISKNFNKEQLNELKDEWEDAAKHEESEMQAFISNKKVEPDSAKKELWHGMAKNAAVRCYFYKQLITRLGINEQNNSI